MILTAGILARSPYHALIPSKHDLLESAGLNQRYDPVYSLIVGTILQIKRPYSMSCDDRLINEKEPEQFEIFLS